MSDSLNEEKDSSIDFSYRGMIEEIRERKIKDFKDKIKSISFPRVPGGARNKN